MIYILSKPLSDFCIKLPPTLLTTQSVHIMHHGGFLTFPNTSPIYRKNCMYRKNNSRFTQISPVCSTYYPSVADITRLSQISPVCRRYHPSVANITRLS